MADSRPRALLVASHGGHWVQLRYLAPAFDGFNVRYVTTNPGVAEEVAPSPVSVVPDANWRDKLALLSLALRMAWVVMRHRPSVVISTGAAPGFLALAFGKMVGARTVWVDSIANAEELSVSGAKVGPFADLWLTQWRHLARPDGPRYLGALL